MSRLPKPQIMVPFDIDNNLMEYTSSWNKPASVVPNYIFEDTLKFE